MKTGRRFLGVIIPVALFACALPTEHNPLLDPRPPELAGIEVIVPDGITEGETFRAMALALSGDGKKRAAEGVTWESLYPEVLAVDGAGLCIGLGQGRGGVRATLESMSATAELDVRRRIDYGRILISEVFYDAEGSDTEREFIEIHNGNDYPCDISGLAVVDGAPASRPFVFPEGSVAGAGSFTVIAASGEGFMELFGIFPDYAGFSFSLNNSGETIMLTRAGEVLDAVFIEGGSSEFPAPPGWGSAQLPGGKEGDSVSRVDFNDTDTHLDWIDGVPSPGR